VKKIAQFRGWTPFDAMCYTVSIRVAESSSGDNQMKKLVTDKANTVKSADNAVLGDMVRDYVALKSQIEALESELAPIKAALTQTVLSMPNGKLEIGDLKLSATMVERESFKLTEALKVLDRRSLAPFISVSTYPQLSVRRKL